MATATRRRGDVVLPVLALIPGALFLVTFVWRAGWDSAGARRFTLFDDAMISMAYARTLAETGEWVWFPGAGRVQGFTNPLWTLWMAVLHWLGLHDSAAALAVSATGVVLLIGTALLAARLVRIALGEWRWGPLASAVAAGTMPFLYPLAFWTLRGMEVGLLAALSLVMAWGLVASLRRWSDGREPTRSLVVAALAGALGVLTRLDFAVVAVVLLACALLWAPDGRQRMRVLLCAVLPVAVAVVAVLVVQQAYWGDWLTNTYRLKMEGFGLLDRLPRGLASAGKALPLLTITVLGLVATLGFATDRVVRRTAVALTSVVGATAAYSVWVGGDAWEWSAMVNRYLSVGLPAALVVTFVGAGHFLERASTGSARQLAPALIVITASGVGYGVLTNPLDLSASNMNTEVFLLLLVSLLLWCAVQLFVRSPDSFARALLAIVCVGLVFWWGDS